MSRRTKLIYWSLGVLLIVGGVWRWVPQLESGRLADQLRNRGGTFDQNEAGDILWLKLPRQTTDQDLLILRNSEKLRHLDLSGTQVTDEGLKNLGVLPRLMKLNLSETGAVQDGLQVAANWPALEELTATDNSWITDEQVGHLRSCPRLQSVDLSGTQITDDGVQALCILPDLQWWTLRDCEQITDVGLEFLMVRKELRAAHVARTSVTWTAWQAARERRPDILDENNPLLFAEFRLLREGGAEYTEFIGQGGTRRLRVAQELPADAFAPLATLPPLHQLIIHSSTLTDDHLIPCLEHSTELYILDVDGASITGRTLSAAARSCPRLARIGVARSRIAAADVSYIAAFDALGSLDLQGLELAGADLSGWERLASLRSIGLEDSSLDDAALETLPTLPELESLSISRTRISADGLSLLARQPSLKYLDIENIPLSESGLQALSRLPLEHLSIGPGFQREFIELLQQTSLRSLTIRDPQLTENDVAALSEMSRRYSLALCGRLGADTLRSLAGLRNLSSLSLRAAEFEAADLDEFRQIRPDVYVDGERPPLPSAQ